MRVGVKLERRSTVCLQQSLAVTSPKTQISKHKQGFGFQGSRLAHSLDAGTGFRGIGFKDLEVWGLPGPKEPIFEGSS